MTSRYDDNGTMTLVRAMCAGIFALVLCLVPTLPAAAATHRLVSDVVDNRHYQLWGDDAWASIPVYPLPGQIVISLSADVQATSDSGEVSFDIFVNGTLTDSLTTSELDGSRMQFSVGVIETETTVDVRARHLDEHECAERSGRMIQLSNLVAGTVGEPRPPLDVRDFFPDRLQAITIVAADNLSTSASTDATNATITSVVSRYSDVTVHIADKPTASEDPRHRTIVLARDAQEPAIGPTPWTLTVPADRAAATLQPLLAIPSRASQIQPLAYFVLDAAPASGSSRAEVNVSIPQAVFGSVPASYTVSINGWAAGPSVPQQDTEVLTILAEDKIVHAQTLGANGDWQATFVLDEPPRDLELRVVVDGVDLSGHCALEGPGVHLGVSHVEVRANGNRTLNDFQAYPQEFINGVMIEADSTGNRFAGELLALMQAASPVPMALDQDATQRIVIEVGDGHGRLTATSNGLALTGSAQNIEALLAALREEGWHSLNGDIATLGAGGIVTTSARSVEPVPDELAFADEPEEPEAPTNETTETASDASSPNPPVGGVPVQTGIPFSVAAAGAFALIVGGVLFTQRHVLLGKRKGPQ